MSRQYIGARYVPIFFDGAQGTEWLPNTQYEPLTIVTRNGNSYTSKRAVPAAIGAPENNAAYWASTGIYNAQVEEIREELQETNERIDDLDNKVDHLSDRKFLFIGDSYMASEYEPLTSANSFVRKAGNMLGLVENTDYFITASGGYGFVANHTFLTLLNNFISANPDEKITDVFIIGGSNDTGNMAGIEAAMRTVKNRIIAVYGNKTRIHIGENGWTPGSQYQYHQLIVTYRNATAANGLAWVDKLYMCGHFDGWKIDDGIHPNDLGQTELARLLVAYIQGSDMHVSPNQTAAELTYESTNFTYFSGINLLTEAEDTIINVTMNRQRFSQFNFQTEATISATDTGLYDIKLGAVSNSWAHGDIYGWLCANAPMAVNRSSGGWSELRTGLVYMMNGDMYARIPAVSGETIYGVRIYGTSWSAPYNIA